MASGWHHSEDSKKRISDSLQNRIISEETRRKLSEGRKGIHLSEETKARISISKKGTQAWNKGKRDAWNRGIPRSEETKKKISLANIGKKINDQVRLKMSIAGKGKNIGNSNPSKRLEVRKKISESKTGKHRSIETKEKISKSLAGRHLTKEHIQNILRRRIPSSLETKFEDIIKRNVLSYKYVGDGSFLIDGCNPDFVNTNGKKIAIEVYAKFFKEKDGRSIKIWKEKRTKRFAGYGWEIIYFDAGQVNEKYILEKLGGN